MTDFIHDPLKTLSSTVALAKPGDRVLIPAGTYRERLAPTVKGLAGSPITIEAQDPANQPVLKGSVVVTGWEQWRGYIWRKTGWNVHSQQLFADGALLQYIGVIPKIAPKSADGKWDVYVPVGSTVEDLVPGSFFYDAVTKTLYCWLADNVSPLDRTMEASVLQNVIGLDGTEFITLRNLQIQHTSAGAFQLGGGGVVLGLGCTADNVTATWCDFAGIAFAYQRSGAKAINCLVRFNGCMGISCDAHTGFLMSGDTMSHNNYRRYSWTWISAGVKITTDSDGTVENCHIYGNKGVGIWTDYCDAGGRIVVRNNHVHDNLGNGLMFECSKNVVASGNKVVRNDARGVYVSGSDDVEVSDNLVLGTKRLAAIDVSGMPRAGKTLTNVKILGNILIENQGDRDMLILKENGTDIKGITVDGNLVVRTGGLRLWWGADGRGNWAGATYATMADWRLATGFDKTGPDVGGDTLPI